MIGRQTGWYPLKNLKTFLVQGLKTVAFERQCQYRSLLGRFNANQCKVTIGHCPPHVSSVYLMSSHVTKSPRLSPSILQVIKNWSQGRPGNEAIN